MANKIEFEATMSTSKFAAGAASLERIAKQSNERMAQTKTDYNSPEVVAMLKQATINKRNRDAETAAILKTQQERKTKLDSMVGQSAFTFGGISPLEQQEKGLRRTAGSYAQLLHVVRATADSLASGQDPTRVLMQQAPQALQALLQMKLGFVALGVAVGAIVVGLGYKFVKAMVDSYTGADKLGEILQRTARMTENLRIKMEQLAEEKQLALKGDVLDARRAQSVEQYAKSARDAATNLREEEMRAAYLAEKKVHTKADELALEKAILKMKEAQALIDLDAAKKNQAGSIAVADATANLSDLKAEQDRDLRQQEAAQKAILDVSKGYGSTPEKEAARKILDEAESKNLKKREEIVQAEKDLAFAKSQNGQGEIDAAKAALLHIQNAINTPAAITAAARHKPFAPGGDALSSIGNFLGANRGLVNSVAEQHLGVARQQLTEQQKTTKAVEKVGEKITSGGGGDIEVPGG